MISISKKVDYGIMLMASMPEYGDQQFRSLKEIAEEKKISAGFLSQVVIPLKKAKLLVAREGAKGGYQLARDARKITLADIIEIIEGPMSLTSCQNKNDVCSCESSCGTKKIWKELQLLMISYLSKKKLSEFLSPSRYKKL